MKKLLLCCVATALNALVATRAQALASLSFSGGSGAPLSITFSQPEIFTITSTASAAPVFVFQGVGDLFPAASGASGLALNGPVTFQIGGGAGLTLNEIASDFAGGNTAATDVYFYGSLPGVTAGNVVTLSAGTETTTSNYAGATPASGNFNVFIADGASGSSISTNGVAVPEPSTWALLGLGAGTAALRRRRNRSLKRTR